MLLSTRQLSTAMPPGEHPPQGREGGKWSYREKGQPPPITTTGLPLARLLLLLLLPPGCRGPLTCSVMYSWGPSA